MKIKADGTAVVVHSGENRRRIIGHYRAWWDCDNGEYHWSNCEFENEAEAIEWGRRVQERYNRIFGGNDEL